MTYCLSSNVHGAVMMDSVPSYTYSKAQSHCYTEQRVNVI